jgi:hypothetical protein
MLLAGIVTGLVQGRRALQATQHREALRQASLVLGNSEVVGTIDQVTTYRSSHAVKYTFIAADGAIYTGESPVPNDMSSGLHENGPLSIRYLPADPNINHPAAWQESDISIWGRLFGPSIFVAGGLFSLLMMRGDRQLVAEGTAVIATVTACSAPVGRSVWFGLNYEFNTEDGTQIQGTGRYGTSLEIGTRIVVLYLPQNPQKNCPYASAYHRATA